MKRPWYIKGLRGQLLFSTAKIRMKEQPRFFSALRKNNVTLSNPNNSGEVRQLTNCWHTLGAAVVTKMKYTTEIWMISCRFAITAAAMMIIRKKDYIKAGKIKFTRPHGFFTSWDYSLKNQNQEIHSLWNEKILSVDVLYKFFHDSVNFSW